MPQRKRNDGSLCDGCVLLVRRVHDGIAKTIIMSSSPCQSFVCFSFNTGKALESAGVVPSNDMTLEAISCKVAYLMGRGDLSTEEIGKLMCVSLRGEGKSTLNILFDWCMTSCLVFLLIFPCRDSDTHRCTTATPIFVHLPANIAQWSYILLVAMCQWSYMLTVAFRQRSQCCCPSLEKLRCR